MDDPYVSLLKAKLEFEAATKRVQEAEAQKDQARALLPQTQQQAETAAQQEPEGPKNLGEAMVRRAKEAREAQRAAHGPSVTHRGLNPRNW